MIYIVQVFLKDSVLHVSYTVPDEGWTNKFPPQNTNYQKNRTQKINNIKQTCINHKINKKVVSVVGPKSGVVLNYVGLGLSANIVIKSL